MCYGSARSARLIVGLGIDLVEIERVAQALERWGQKLIRRLMDAAEADALPPAGEARVHATALAIAGKEAASKALGTGWSRGVRWRDVVVERGAPPALTLHGRAAEVARELGSTGVTDTRLEIRGSLALAEVRLLS